MAAEPKAALFQIVGRRNGGQLTGKAVFQRDAHDIIRRRAEAAGIRTKIGTRRHAG